MNLPSFDTWILFARRFLSLLIDQAILGIASGLWQWLFGPTNTLWLTFVFTLLYTSAFLWRFHATPGMMALRLTMAREDEKPLSLGTLLVRFFASILSSMLIVGDLLMLVTPKQQTLQDLIASTVVSRV